MKTDNRQIEFDNPEEIKAFSNRIENMLKKEKKSLVARETWVNILRSIPPILAPWTSRGLEYLAGYTGIVSGSQYLNETKNFMEDSEYRAIGNKLSVSFINEVDETMPEIEREAKNADYLKTSIQRLSNNAIRFIRAKTQFKGGFFGIGISLAAMSLPALSGLVTSGLIAGMTTLGTTAGIAASAGLITYISTNSTLRKRRKKLITANKDLISAYSNSEKAKTAALSNTAFKTTTYSDNSSIQRLEKTLKEEDGVYKNFLSFFKRSTQNISLINLGINLGVLTGCYALGLPIATLATVYMGISVMNSSIRSMQDSWIRIHEGADSMYEQYKNIQHNKIYDLTYGHEKINSNANAIELRNLCYAHRYNGSDKTKIGLRGNIPFIQSDKTITITPGINIIGGASGAGKSTFYKLLRHADDLTYGSISYGEEKDGKFQGIQTIKMPKNEIGKHIAFCFQEIENDGQSGLDIIRSGNPFMPIEHIEMAAENLELGLYKETPEKGKEPKLFSEMSGGEKKRILFLQAYLSPKRFIVFDEPTSGVDPATAEKMLDMINNDYIEIEGKKEKRTILYTTHNPEDLKKLDITQVIDLAPIEDAKKIQSFIEKHGITKLPTTLSVYPFQTEDEKRAYIELVQSRHNDKEDSASNAKHNIQVFISMSIAARQEWELEQKKEDEVRYSTSEEKNGFLKSVRNKLSGR